jgi:hypothetical protein
MDKAVVRKGRDNFPALLFLFGSSRQLSR